MRGHRDEPPANATAALERRVWRALEGVCDPEIPVLDVVEMGIVRDVSVRESRTPDAHDRPEEVTISVTVTPTFSACPALHEIVRNVRETALSAAVAADASTYHRVEVITSLSPPWSSDHMTQAARDKLERFGIAPAQPHGGLIEVALEAPVRCPRCGYPDTRVRNSFGSTLCREIRSCLSCDETFERFKPL